MTGTGDTIAVDGSVTLREAITSINNGANVNADVVAVGPYGTNDQIVFNIPGTGLHTIAPASNLPNITKPVVIDGYTQPGSTLNTLPVGDNAVITIEISGINYASSCEGVAVRASNTTIRGLAIHVCQGPLDIRSADGFKVIGNFLGTDPGGSVVDWPSIAYGLYVEDSSNGTIGGTSPADRILVSGGVLGGGIFLNTTSGAASPTSNNVIQGNYIGTDRTGTAALPNINGIFVGLNCTNNLIGGTASGSGNLISGNGKFGIGISLSSSSTVQGNLIGTDATGSSPLPNGSALNGGAGILIQGNGNVIGGAAAGAGNVIAYNIGPPYTASPQGHGQGGRSLRGDRKHHPPQLDLFQQRSRNRPEGRRCDAR